jgi:hypothetical protein
LLLVERKGAATIDSYTDDHANVSIDSAYSQLHADKSKQIIFKSDEPIKQEDKKEKVWFFQISSRVFRAVTKELLY